MQGLDQVSAPAVSILDRLGARFGLSPDPTRSAMGSYAVDEFLGGLRR